MKRALPLLRGIEGHLRRLDQERRNARMIGEMVVRQVESRFRPSRPVDYEAAPVTDDNVTQRSSTPQDAAVDRWSLLGVHELIAMIDELDSDELQSLADAERRGRNRAAVLEAIARRQGHAQS